MIASSVAVVLLLLPWTLRGRSLGQVLAWPGTVAHELAHFVVALLCGARPQTLRLWPERSAEGTVLGSVAFRANWLTAGWVALAPLWLLGPFAVWLLAFRAAGSLAEECAAGVIAGYCLQACTPSRTDWLLALRHPLGSALVIAFLALLAAWAGAHLWGPPAPA